MADPTLRDFPDRHERIIQREQVGKFGGQNLEHLPGVLKSLYDETQAAHRRISASGGLVSADTAALQAIEKADLVTALASDETDVVIAYKLDEHRWFRWDATATNTPGANYIQSGEGGDGRWVALHNGIGGAGGTGDFLADGSVPMTGALDMGTNNVTNAGTFNGITIDSNVMRLNVAGQVSGLTSKAAPVAGDHLLINDSAAADAVRRILLSAIPVAGEASGTLGAITLSTTAIRTAIGNDSSVFQTDWANQITGLTEDFGPASTHFVMIENSISGMKRKVQLGNLPSSGGGGGGGLTVMDGYSTWAFPQNLVTLSSFSFVTLDDFNIAAEVDVDPTGWVVGDWIQFQFWVYVNNGVNATMHFRLYDSSQFLPIVDSQNDDNNSTNVQPETGWHFFTVNMLVEDTSNMSLMGQSAQMHCPTLPDLNPGTNNTFFNWSTTRTIEVQVYTDNASAQAKIGHFGYQKLT